MVFRGDSNGEQQCNFLQMLKMLLFVDHSIANITQTGFDIAANEPPNVFVTWGIDPSSPPAGVEQAAADSGGRLPDAPGARRGGPHLAALLIRVGRG